MNKLEVNKMERKIHELNLLKEEIKLRQQHLNTLLASENPDNLLILALSQELDQKIVAYYISLTSQKK